MSCPSPAPSFAVHPLAGQPWMPVEVWRAPRSSVTVLDPGVVGDRPVPHLLAALLTPTHVPHARLPKHWEGQIISSALVRHPLLARFSRPLLFPLSFRFSSPHTFPFRTLFSLPFSPHFLSSDFFSQNVLLTRFYIPGPSPRGAVRPKLTPRHWRAVTMMTRALPKKAGVGAHERLPLRKNGGGLQSS